MSGAHRDPADHAWQKLFAELPRRAPSADFRQRLLQATRPAWPTAPVAAEPVGLRTELAVTAGVIAGAAGLTLAPVALVAALFVVDTGVVVEAVARLCVWLVSWLSAGVSVWDVLARASRVTAAAMTSPAGTMVLIGGVLTAWVALAGLSRIIPAERETSDA